jgi:hypothetical protein
MEVIRSIFGCRHECHVVPYVTTDVVSASLDCLAPPFQRSPGLKS